MIRIWVSGYHEIDMICAVPTLYVLYKLVTNVYKPTVDNNNHPPWPVREPERDGISALLVSPHLEKIDLVHLLISQQVYLDSVFDMLYAWEH